MTGLVPPPPPPAPRGTTDSTSSDGRGGGRIGWIVAGAMVGLLLLAGAFALGRMSRQSEIDDLRAESGELQADVVDLEAALEATGAEFASTEVCREALAEGQSLIDLWEDVWQAELDWWETEVDSPEEAEVEQRLDELFDQIDDKADSWAEAKGSCRETLPEQEEGGV